MPAVSPIRRSTPGMLVAVVVLAVLFVGAIAAFLVVYSERGTLVANAAGSEQEVERMRTRLRTLNAQLGELKTFVGEDSAAEFSDAKSNLTAKLVDYLQLQPSWDPEAAAVATSIRQQIRDTPNTETVLSRLHQWVQKAADRIQSLETANVQLTEQKQTLQGQLDAVTEEKEALSESLTNRIEQLEKEKQQLQAKHMADYNALEAKREAQLDEADRAITELGRQLQEVQSEKQILDNRVKELQAQLEPPAGGDPDADDETLPGISARYQPDGKLLSADIERGVVYIDLGSNDNLPLGIQFRVYSAERTDLDPVHEGKGLIEVTRLGLTLAECRIVSTAEGEMVAGDVVVNPVYNHGQQMKFFVFGQFDLDGDGRADARGMERIRQLIENWGGQIIDRISVDTDYGVMGMEPERPQEPQNPDPVTEQQYKQKLAQYEEYRQQLANLRGLSVPILNQNRFLSLIGYYERQATGLVP